MVRDIVVPASCALELLVATSSSLAQTNQHHEDPFSKWIRRGGERALDCGIEEVSENLLSTYIRPCSARLG